MRWMGMWLLWDRGEVHTGFWWGNLREMGHFEDIGVDRRVILKWIFKNWNGAWVDLAQDTYDIRW
jgi:hypothetical protein